MMNAPFFSSPSGFVKSGSVDKPGKSRGTFELSSSELRDEVPLLALSDLPRAVTLSEDGSFDDSGSGGVPVDCCFRFLYSDIDS